MLNKALFIAATLAVTLGAPVAFAADKAAEKAADKAFECPWAKPADEPAAVKELRVSFGKQDPLNEPDALDAAVDQLRKAGANRAQVIDNLISAYCPVVADNAALNNRQKAARVQRFASVAAPLVYSLENAEEIILNVPVPPDVLDAVNARAHAAKITPEEWAAAAVSSAATAK